MTPRILITPGSIVVSLDGKTRTFLSSQKETYGRIKQYVMDEDWKCLLEEMDIEAKSSAMGVKVEKDHLVEESGKPAHPTIAERIFPLPIKVIRYFKEHCEKNPDPRSITDLHDFLRHKGLPITPQGTFLAFKSVTPTFKDHRTGKVDNSVGQEPFMPRENCDMNRSTSCSTGYHAGTFNYTENFYKPNQLVVVEISPQHVTSVPLDSSNQKLRCHHYRVIDCYKGPREFVDAMEYIQGLARSKDKKKPATEEVPPINPRPEALREEKQTQATKKEVLAYALHLKNTRKGAKYIQKMVISKFKDGLEILKDIAKNPRNPSRINTATRETLLSILGV